MSFHSLLSEPRSSIGANAEEAKIVAINHPFRTTLNPSDPLEGFRERRGEEEGEDLKNFQMKQRSSGKFGKNDEEGCREGIRKLESLEGERREVENKVGDAALILV